MHQIDTTCPYCQGLTAVNWPDDFAGHYSTCLRCGERFVMERTGDGLRTWTLADAPCCSDPECRETELSQGDEE